MSHLKKKHIIEGTLVTDRKMLELQEYKARIVFILDLRKTYIRNLKIFPLTIIIG